MQAKFEQALEAVRSLSTQDYERLWRWMQEHRRENGNEEHAGIAPRSDDERSQRTKTWIEENRAKYLGEWVALDGDRLISHDKDGRKVMAEAKASGINGLFFDLLVEDKKPFVGGWLP